MAVITKKTRIVVTLIGSLMLVTSMLYMAGTFRVGLIRPGTVHGEKTPPSPERIVVAVMRGVPQVYEAVGVVRARTEVSIAPQVSGRILFVAVREGDLVLEGDLLVQLDSREFQSRVSQAREAVRGARAHQERVREALTGAQALHEEVRSRRDRVKSYFEQEAATRQELERVEAAYGSARGAVGEAAKAVEAAGAEVERAVKFEEEAMVALDHTILKAPHEGRVARRMVDPGDMALPGKPLLVLDSPQSLQLEARVREGLIARIARDDRLPVHVDALDVVLEGTVREIVPSGDPSTRSFLVKVSVPPREGLLPGMFARLHVPLDERDVILVPREAIRRIGQMEVVRVEEDGHWFDIFVKTGREIQGQVEVLSGLHGNEKVALVRGENADSPEPHENRRDDVSSGKNDTPNDAPGEDAGRRGP